MNLLATTGNSTSADTINLRELFAREALIRANRPVFKLNAEEILEKRNLPLSKIAMDYYFKLLNREEDDIRKDGKTPREQHELSHVTALNDLLEEVGEDWIDDEKYGSVDALFAAIILHDVIEDFKIPPDNIQAHLQTELQKLYENETLTWPEFQQAHKDIEHTVNIVVALSRKDAKGNVIEEDDRIAQANNWLTHPYCFPIKQIDWANKLQSMVGVEHFEKDNYKKMAKVVAETGLLFVKEQQGMARQAIKKYPFLRDVCKPMDGVMGIMFQTLNTYVKLKQGDLYFSPKSAQPFYFNDYINQAKSLVSRFFTGNNYITPMLERFEEVAQNDKETRNFLKHMLLPSFKTLPVVTKEISFGLN